MTLESDKLTGGCLGVGLGYFVGWGCMFWVGLLLCFTGIGAIIGAPMLLVGLALPFITGPLMAYLMVKGTCPYCSGVVSFAKSALGVDCPSCKKRIIVRNNVLLKIDP